MAIKELLFDEPIHDFHTVEVRRKKSSNNHAEFTLSNPAQGKSEKADGVLILQWSQEPDEKLALPGVALFSECEGLGAYWMIYKLTSGNKFHIEDIERLHLDQEVAALREYCLPDRERWLWTYSLPSECVTTGNLTEALEQTCNEQDQSDRIAIIVELTKTDGTVVFHFVKDLELISDERKSGYTRERVCVLRPFAEDGWRAFGYPNATPVPCVQPAVDSAPVKPAMSASPSIAGHQPPPRGHKQLK